MKRNNTHTTTVRYYDWAASYLINRDVSGLTQEEKDHADMFVRMVEKSYGKVNFIDAEEYGFGTPDIGNWFKGQLATYTIQY